MAMPQRLLVCVPEARALPRIANFSGSNAVTHFRRPENTRHSHDALMH